MSPAFELPNRGIFTRRGQRYRIGEAIPYTTRRGEQTVLYRVQSRCPECNEIFDTTATVGALCKPDGYLRRRCDAHRRPGVPVRWEDGRDGFV